MKPAHALVLCIAALSALIGGTVYVLHLQFGFGTNCSASIPDIMVNDTLRIALLRYKIDCGRFPTTEEGLQALLEAPVGQTGWKGPYLETKTGSRKILDPWERPYRYVCPGIKNPKFYDLWSEGPDPDTARDDIVNWHR